MIVSDRHFVRLLLVIFCLLPAGYRCAFAQKAEIPELKKRLRQVASDSAKSHILAELGRIYTDESQDSCFYYLEYALRLARQSRDPVSITRAMCQLGRSSLYHRKDEAKALYWLRQSVERAKKTNDYLHLSVAYRMLAAIALHQHVGDVEALLEQCVLYARKAGNWRVLAEAYGAQFELLTKIGVKDVNRLTAILRLGMVACEKYDTDLWFTHGLDYCDFLIENNRQAESYALATKLAAKTHKLRKNYGEFVYINDMARLAAKLYQYDKAEQIQLKAIADEKSKARPDTLHLIFHYMDLVATYEQQKAWEKAFKLSKPLSTLRLALQRNRQTRDARLQAVQLKASFELEKKQNELNLMTVRQQQQQMLLIGMLTAALLLTGFVVILRKNQRRIESQKAELTRLNGHLTHLNSTQHKLFAILAHDLRSPVARLRNELMLAEWNGEGLSALSQDAGVWSRQFNQLQNLLDNTLTWALTQLNGISPVPQWIRPASLIDEQIMEQKAVAVEKQITVVKQIPEELQLLLDENHLIIIVRNLLQNALKFTRSGGVVTINYSFSNACHQFYFTDTGIGMTPEQISRLFTLAQPSKRGTANENGTGLGLVLVYELVRANGGEITVSSETGTGSTFTIVFPA